MTPDDMDAIGVAAWADIASRMKVRGTTRALREMLIETPDALAVAVEWMKRQPMKRRLALADELLGPAEAQTRR